MTPEDLQHDHHANPENAAVKPGWKTSEFWLKVAALVVSLVLMSGYLDVSNAQHAKLYDALVAIAGILAALGYAGLRTSAKKTAAEGATEIAVARVAGPAAINLLKSAGVSDPPPPASS